MRINKETVDQLAQEKNIKDNAYAWISNEMSESPEEDIEFGAEVAEDYWKDGFTEGVKWQSERMYNEEEVIVLLQKYRFDLSSGTTPIIGDTVLSWFEQFKKKV